MTRRGLSSSRLQVSALGIVRGIYRSAEWLHWSLHVLKTKYTRGLKFAYGPLFMMQGTARSCKLTPRIHVHVPSKHYAIASVDALGTVHVSVTARKEVYCLQFPWTKPKVPLPAILNVDSTQSGFFYKLTCWCVCLYSITSNHIKYECG